MLNEYLYLLINWIPKELLIHEIFHGIFALPFAYFVYRKTRSKIRFFAVIFFCYLVDIDHLLDYFLYYGWRIEPKAFFSGIYFDFSKRAIVLFHAWEWILLLGIMGKKTVWKSFSVLIATSLLAHLIFDTINVGRPLFYSIIYRSIKGFYDL